MKRFLWILMATLAILLAPSKLLAQSGLCISHIFDQYGSDKGVTMVELSKDMLKTYKITLYKSISFKDVTNYLPAILKCLDDDKANNKARKIQEVIEDGSIISAYYQLPTITSKDKTQLKRYILDKLGAKNKATLVYIDGSFNSGKLMEISYHK